MVTRYIKDAFLYGAGDTVVGQVRKANEDNCGYAKTPNGELFVVCDGMGGHVGGATASKIAVDSIISYIKEKNVADKRILLREALLFANMQILGASEANPSLKGMGTTACVVLVNNADIWIAHVGDSRIYLYSEQEKYLYRITKDHSLVQGLVDQGQLDDREAEHHPQKNIILRALGSKPDVEPDVEKSAIKAQVGDTFLICSDGLSGMIDDNQIEVILKEDRPLEDKVQKLIDSANTPDKGKDNITAQLVQVLSSPDNVSSHPNFNPKWRQKGNVTQKPLRTIGDYGAQTATSLNEHTAKTTKKINKQLIFGIVACVVLAIIVGASIALIKTANKLDKKNDDLAGKNVVLKEDIKTVEAENEELNSRNDELTTKNSDLVGKNKELTGVNTELKRMNEELERENEKLKKKLDNASKAGKITPLKNEEPVKSADSTLTSSSANNNSSTSTEPVTPTEHASSSTSSNSEIAEPAKKVTSTTKTVQSDGSTTETKEQAPAVQEIKESVSLNAKWPGNERSFSDNEVFGKDGLNDNDSKVIEWKNKNPDVVELTESTKKKGVKGLKKGEAQIIGEKDGKKYILKVTVK